MSAENVSLHSFFSCHVGCNLLQSDSSLCWCFPLYPGMCCRKYCAKFCPRASLTFGLTFHALRKKDVMSLKTIWSNNLAVNSDNYALYGISVWFLHFILVACCQYMKQYFADWYLLLLPLISIFTKCLFLSLFLSV